MARRAIKAMLKVSGAIFLFMAYGTIGSLDRDLIALDTGIMRLVVYIAIAAVCIILSNMRRKRKWRRA